MSGGVQVKGEGQKAAYHDAGVARDFQTKYGGVVDDAEEVGDDNGGRGELIRTVQVQNVIELARR